MAQITSSSFAYCSDCTASNTDDHERSRPLTEIGDEVYLPGESYTRYLFYQCPACGHLWQKIRDGGRGGHGTSWTRLTKP